MARRLGGASDRRWLAARLAPWREHPSTSAVITDFDGTLAPIVDDPSLAVPLEGTREVLVALAASYALVGVVSGRPVGYLLERLGLPGEITSSSAATTAAGDGVPGPVPGGVLLAGLYGLERALGGRVETLPAASRWRPVVSEVATQAERRAPAGLRVEHKGLSLTLHFREAPELASWADAFAREQSAATGLEAFDGRRSVELRPPVDHDKGTVVAQWAAGMTAVCYLGDDLGDLPAFRHLAQLRDHGVATLCVAAESVESPRELLEVADLRVDGAAGALEVLIALAQV